MLIRKMFLLVCVVCASLFYALPVELSTAETVARSKLFHDGKQDDHAITLFSPITNHENGTILAYVFDLDPVGYVIVGADTRLPPVIAYSYTNLCRDDQHDENILFNLVQRDMIARFSSTSENAE